jgi:hypothetical protein
MASDAGARIVFCLDGVNLYEVAAVTFGYVVAAKILFAQFYVATGSTVAFHAVSLGMAISAIAPRLAGNGAVFSHPVRILMVLAGPVIVMGKCYPLFLMTVVAILQIQFRVFLV